MGIKSKAAGLLVIVLGVIGVAGVAMAAPKKKENNSSPNEDEDIEVTSEDGVTSIVMDAETAKKGETEEVFPEVEIDFGPAEIHSDKTTDAISDVIDNAIIVESEGGQSTPVDDKVKKIAKETGKTEKQAITEAVKEIMQGQTPSDLAITETSKELDPNGTVTLARLLLVREEMPGWKEDLKSDVGEWQEKVGLLKDGKFGLKSVARMGLEVGILPLVRFFPKDVYNKSQAKAAYDERIRGVIDDMKAELPDSQAQIDGLTMSMGREKAQSFGNTNPPPQSTLKFIQDVNDAIAEAAERETEAELKG